MGITSSKIARAIIPNRNRRVYSAIHPVEDICKPRSSLMLGENRFCEYKMQFKIGLKLVQNDFDKVYLSKSIIAEFSDDHMQRLP